MGPRSQKLLKKWPKLIWSKIRTFLLFESCRQLNFEWKICRNHVWVSIRSKVMTEYKSWLHFCYTQILVKSLRLLIGRNFWTDRVSDMVFIYFPLKIQLPTTFKRQTCPNFGPKKFWWFFERFFASGAHGRQLFFWPRTFLESSGHGNSKMV